MQVIHFTRDAADFLAGFDAEGTWFVPLVDGDGDTHVSCLHLSAGAKIPAPPSTHDCALLVIHGRVIVRSETCGDARIDLPAGTGAVLKAREQYTVESELGAIVLAVEARHLEATRRSISTPGRIAGATWPCDECRSPENDRAGDRRG